MKIMCRFYDGNIAGFNNVTSEMLIRDYDCRYVFLDFFFNFACKMQMMRMANYKKICETKPV